MKYKIGDKVVCVPGYVNRDISLNNYGGLGYEPNKVFVIRGFNGCDVLWPDDGGHGVYRRAVEPYIPISINKKINKHEFI